MPRVTPDGYRKIADVLPLLECNACGSVVSSPGHHDEWHQRLIDRLAEIERGNVNVNVDRLHSAADRFERELGRRAERATRQVRVDEIRKRLA